MPRSCRWNNVKSASTPYNLVRTRLTGQNGPPYAAGVKHALPARARVVVIGGGVVGCSTAYHLAKRGWTDVVLLERKRLTSGTTWHAAGLITQARPTYGTREIVRRSLRVFQTLEEETGFAAGFERTGTVHLADGV